MKKQEIILIHYSSYVNSYEENRKNIPAKLECENVIIYNIFSLRPNILAAVEKIYESPIFECEKSESKEEEESFNFPRFEDVMEKAEKFGWNSITDFFREKIEEEKNRRVKQTVHKTVESGEKVVNDFKNKAEEFTSNLKNTVNKVRNSPEIQKNLENLFSSLKDSMKNNKENTSN